MNENKLTPSIRFKNNDGENYPEWDFVKVKEIASINTGNKDTKDAVENGQYDFYVRSPIVHKIDSFSYDGEAVLTVGDGVGVGKVFHYVNGKFNFHQRVYKISDFKDYYGLLFYYYFQKKFLKEAQKYNAKTSVDSVRKSMIADMYVPKIEMSEQIKIGNFFSKLDRQIELEEQKLEKLEEQKKGYMQQIFSQELRFKDENGNDYPTWKKTTIKEVAKLTVGKSKKNENTGKYIIMDMGTVTKNGTMLTHKSTPHENDLLNKGDLVMPKDDIGGGHIIGKTVFIPESQKYVLGDHVYRLETKKCNGLFLHFYINSDIVNRSLKRKVTGSAQLGLNRKSVEEELVKVPCLEEQEKIGAFFSKLDTFIEKQLSKIELLKERKKGFLQKMFV
ncbi:restriction endonuclease subunit S [Staphylococcus gallinarum]|uniref:restriction endonuclease subunit S n=1 Tax=Staphylococcus gallinarum TaxID=1293 RepID=UPI0015FD1345|nr:restriction endonuclease subunit S [Staphylococcus gallinarum]